VAGLLAKRFSRIVIVCNRRFIPALEHGPYIYGVVQHVFHLAGLLARAGWGVSFVLYERDDSCNTPEIYRTRVVQRYQASVLRYNIRMPHTGLMEALRHAINISASREGGRADADLPLVYLQTDVLIPFVPPEFNVLITHHAPFVDAVCYSLGENQARRAFEWDHPKMDSLRAQQQQGLSILRERTNIRCLEISTLQEEFLRQSMVPASKISRIAPPVGGFTPKVPLPAELTSALQSVSKDSMLTVMTAVSRFDLFKNIDLLVNACVHGMRQGTVRKAIIIGGSDADAERARLRDSVPSSLRSSFTFVKRLSHAAVVGNAFPALACSGVFVCTSRYDLVPLTVLEASRSGLCTLIPDSRLVGASEYIPEEYRFQPDVDGLASLLRSVSEDRNLLKSFESTAQEINSMVSDETVLSDFSRVCSSFQ
jgi:glycosyltransferase involved in cell wall biosynthesis